MDLCSVRLKALLEQDDQESSAWRPIPGLNRSFHRTPRELLISSHFTPFRWFLVLHYFCRIFHHVLVGRLLASDVPEMGNPKMRRSKVVAAIQLGSCPFEEGIAVNNREEFFRIHFPLLPQDQFYPVGNTAILIRTTTMVGVIGVIRTKNALGVYEFEVWSDSIATTVRGRGVMVQRPTPCFCYSSERSISYPTPSRSNVLGFVEVLDALEGLLTLGASHIQPSCTRFGGKTYTFQHWDAQLVDGLKTVRTLREKYRPALISQILDGSPYDIVTTGCRTNWRDEQRPILAKPTYAAELMEPHVIGRMDYGIAPRGQVREGTVVPNHHGPCFLPAREDDYLFYGRYAIKALALTAGDAKDAPAAQDPTHFEDGITRKAQEEQWAELGVLTKDTVQEQQRGRTKATVQTAYYTSWRVPLRGQVILEPENLGVSIFPPFMSLRWGEDIEHFYTPLQRGSITLALVSTPFWPEDLYPPIPEPRFERLAVKGSNPAFPLPVVWRFVRAYCGPNIPQIKQHFMTWSYKSIPLPFTSKADEDEDSVIDRLQLTIEEPMRSAVLKPYSPSLIFKSGDRVNGLSAYHRQARTSSGWYYQRPYDFVSWDPKWCSFLDLDEDGKPHPMVTTSQEAARSSHQPDSWGAS